MNDDFDGIDALKWLVDCPCWDDLLENIRSVGHPGLADLLSNDVYELREWANTAYALLSDGRTEYSNGVSFEREYTLLTTDDAGVEHREVFTAPQSPSGEVYQEYDLCAVDWAD